MEDDYHQGGPKPDVIMNKGDRKLSPFISPPSHQTANSTPIYQSKKFDLPDVQIKSPIKKRYIFKKAPATKRVSVPTPQPEDQQPSPIPSNVNPTRRRHLPLHLPVLRQVFLTGEEEREDTAYSALRSNKESHMRTGEEAVAFFALHGNSSSVKFVYCNRKVEPDQYRPYDLEVVPKKCTNPEFFTISATGIVHIAPGHPSTFIPLVDWIRESTNFNVLTSIRFFKHYLPGKAFRLWSNNVRYNLFKKKRKMLTSNLFLAKQSFCQPLTEINKLMYELQAIRLSNVKSQTYLAKEFVKDQAEQRARAGKKFEEILERLHSTVDRVCTDVKERARSSSEGLIGNDSNNMITIMFPHQQKNLSLVKMKEERARRLRQMRWAAREADMLSDFIRLADYMVVENLVILTLSTNSEFLEVLQAPRKAGLFQTTVSYGPNSLLFGISDTDICTIVEKMVDGMIATVESAPRITQLNAFKHIIGSSIVTSNEPNVALTIRNNTQFVQTFHQIQERIKRDFEQAVSIAQVFEQWREVHQFDEGWTIKHFRLANPTVEEIQKCMARQTAWHTDVDRNMRPGFAVGIFHIESRKLKNRLLPIVDKALMEMEELLLESFHSKCEDALRKYTNCIAALAFSPTSLSEFAEHISSQKKFKQDAPNLAKLSDQVELMYDLLTSSTHKLVLPSQDAVLLDELRSSKKSFIERLAIEWEKSRSRMPEIREDVDQNIAKLNLELHALDGSLSQGLFVDIHATPDTVIAEIEVMGATLSNIQQNAAVLNNYQTIFDIETNPFVQLQEVKEKFSTKKEFWTLYQEWIDRTSEWENGSFFQIDVAKMGNLVNNFSKDIIRLVKRESTPLTNMIRDMIEEWRSIMPMILDLGNKSLKQKHWEAMFSFIGQEFIFSNNLDLHKIRSVNLLSYPDLIADTVATAVGEFSLQSTFATTRQLWEGLDLPLEPYRDSTEIFILGNMETVLTYLEDSQMTLQTMISSRYISSLQTDVEEWISRMSSISDICEIWSSCQRSWMYLEPIFSTVDFIKQLPTESKRFADIDRTWRDLMRRVNRKPNAYNVCAAPGLFNTLKNANKELESLQKCLNQYLETKRVRFPRFYFLSDNQVFKMISETRQPSDIKPHLNKVLEHVRDVKFIRTADSLQIVGVMGTGDEYFALDSPVIIMGNLEDWLSALEKSITNSIREQIRKGFENYPQEALHWEASLFKQLSQVAVVVDKLANTAAIERAIIAGDVSLSSALSQTITGITRYAELASQQEKTPTQRATVMSLITMSVDRRDVLTQLIAKGCGNVTESDWASNIRYYWDAETAHMTVRVDRCSFRYGYEYIGPLHHLVLTANTKRCQRALASTAFSHYGGVVWGPTCTGKSEMVKDVAKYLGFQCLTVDCQETMGPSVFVQLFSGIVQLGAWVCFDNMFRIEPGALAAVAQHILTIRHALNSSRHEFLFEGRMTPVNANVGIFTTAETVNFKDASVMPDNIKHLFRPISIAKTDCHAIANVCLLHEGFNQSSSAQLAKNFMDFVSKLDTYLSRSNGLPKSCNVRTSKMIIRFAGTMFRSQPNRTAESCIIAAVHQLITPTLGHSDISVVEAYLSQTFQMQETPSISPLETPLGKSISAEIASHQWNLGNKFISKVMQLYDATLSQMGVVLLGPPASGKSLSIAVLMSALTAYLQQNSQEHEFPKVNRHVVYPASLSMEQLYGKLDPVSKQWSDGIITMLFRDAVGAQSRSWLVFDGCVDAAWMQPLYSALDVSRFLFCNNGERIPVSPFTTLMFESSDLSNAAPDFVSRCIIVRFEEEDFECNALIDKWAVGFQERFGARASRVLMSMREHISPVLKFVRASCTERVVSTDAVLVNSCFNLLDALLVPERAADPSVHGDEGVNRVISMYLLFAIIWSIGGRIDDRSQIMFSAFIRSRFAKGRSSGIPLPPEQGTVYDYYVSSERATYLPWSQRMEAYEFDPNKPFDTMLVPTTDSVRYRFILELLTSIGSHVIFASKNGVGKTAQIQSFVSSASQRAVTISIPFSVHTTPVELQNHIECKLDTKRRSVVGPPAGKKLLIFVDDVNLPCASDCRYDSVEFLRQCLDSGGFHDWKSLNFKRLVDTIFVGAMSFSTIGAHNKDSHAARLLHHFQAIWWSEPSDAVARSIFGSILSNFLKVSNIALEDAVKPLITSLISMGQRLKQKKQWKSGTLGIDHMFTFHDFNKIVQGILLVGPSHKFSDKGSLVRVWVHEIFRVFRDRLHQSSDIDLVNTVVCEETQISLPGVSVPVDDIYSFPIDGSTSQQYDVVTDMAKMHKDVSRHLAAFNRNSDSEMNLVLFDDALVHICRLCRILRMVGSHVFLLGPHGCGRQSLTRLASFTLGYEHRSPARTTVFNRLEWWSELQKVISIAGVDNRGIVFFLCQIHMIDDSMFGDLAFLMSTADMHYIYSSEEFEQVLNRVKANAESIGQCLNNREEVYRYFVRCIRNNLHLVVSLDSASPSKVEHYRKFSHSSQCHIYVMKGWDNQVLSTVAQQYIRVQSTSLNISALEQTICHACSYMHETVGQAAKHFYEKFRRHVHHTSTAYLELVKFYLLLFQEQFRKNSESEEKYRTGLCKLREANELVLRLASDSEKLQKELLAASEESVALHAVLERDQAVENEKSVIYAKEAAEFEEMARRVQVIKDECQRDLQEALPTLEAAISALDTINKEDLSVVKTYVNPPKLVELVMSAVCLLMGEPQTWSAAKRMLGDLQIIDLLKQFDKDSISNRVMKKLQVYIENSEFTPENCKNISTATTSLCSWVCSIYKYGLVADQVEPKRKALQQAKEDLSKAEGVLLAKTGSLAEVRSRIASLQHRHKESVAAQTATRVQVDTISQRLLRAEELMNGLSDEETRWSASLKALESSEALLPGNVLLAAAQITYFGPFSEDFRKELLLSWMNFCSSNNLPINKQYSLVRLFADPILISDWCANGLPPDEFSLENGLVLERGRRWPLLIDPESVGNRWIRKMGRSKSLKVTSLDTPGSFTVVEDCIKRGETLLLEDMGETFEVNLESVLKKQIFLQGGNWFLRFGDRSIPYSADFRLYMTTRLSNPSYSPDDFNQVTVINFVMTPSILSEELLTIVTRTERPELEERYHGLITKVADNKQQLTTIEDRILQLLSMSSGSILDNIGLIQDLSVSSKSVHSLKSAVNNSETMLLEIRSTREQYRIVAQRGCAIYFTMTALRKISSVYQFSLPQFLAVFDSRIKTSTKPEDLTSRIQHILDDITSAFHAQISRALFDQHKLIFSFCLAVECCRQRGQISESDWDLFLYDAHTAKGSDLPAGIIEKAREWMTQETWTKLINIAALPVFSGLGHDIVSRDEWATIMSSPVLQAESLPDDWKLKLTPFQRLIVIKTIRPNDLYAAMKQFVKTELEESYAGRNPISLQATLSEFHNPCVILFLASQDFDVFTYLSASGRELGIPKLASLSLGALQSEELELAVRQAKISGDWLFIRNCHLANTCAPTLQRIIESLANDADSKSTFRLFLSATPSSTISAVFVQECTKIALEQPSSIQGKLFQIYSSMSSQASQDCLQPLVYQRLTFALAYFHGVISSRSHLAWSSPYQPEQSDFAISLAQLRTALNQREPFVLDAFREVVSSVNYGAHSQEELDLLRISNYAHEFLNASAIDPNQGVSNLCPPPTESINSVREFILTSSYPELYKILGMSSSLSTTKNQFQAAMAMNALSVLFPAPVSAGDSNELALDIATSLQERLPSNIELESESQKLADNVSHEIILFNRLLDVVRHSLTDFVSDVGSEGESGPVSVQIFNSLVNDEVPDVWRKVSFAFSKGLAAWFGDLLARVEYFRTWAKSGAPTTVSLASFFRIDLYLASSLSLLSDQCIVLSSIPSEISIQIRDVYLYDASWDTTANTIKEPLHPGEPHQLAAITLSVAVRKDVSASTIECPVYMTMDRRRPFAINTEPYPITYIRIPVPEDQMQYWLRREVSFMTNID